MNWHRLSIKETFELLDTRQHGLSMTDTEEKMLQYGPNELQEGKKKSIAGMLLTQFKDVMTLKGMDRTHNPEFTILEFYTAYKDYLWMTETTEQLLEKAALAVLAKHKNNFVFMLTAVYTNLILRDDCFDK